MHLFAPSSIDLQVEMEQKILFDIKFIMKVVQIASSNTKAGIWE
jgi:hypothetical protein